MRNRIIQATVLLVTLAVTAFSGRCFAQIAAQSTDSSAQTSQSSTQDNSQQTLDGCLVREEHAVYLMPASGDKTQVSARRPGPQLSHGRGSAPKRQPGRFASIPEQRIFLFGGIVNRR